MVREVDWSPVYDLHATTVDERTSSDVSFLYTARIIQKSGEDWSNVKLTLSTANSQMHKALSIPTLSARTLAPKVGFGR